MATYMKEMDAPDVGDYLTFFAYTDPYDESRWIWRYGLTLTSTYHLGSMGKYGDGIDFVLDEGELQVVDLSDAERELSDFADDNMPSVSDELIDEFNYDFDLYEMGELSKKCPELSFAELYMEITDQEADDPYVMEAIERLGEYARANGWEFEF